MRALATLGLVALVALTGCPNGGTRPDGGGTGGGSSATGAGGGTASGGGPGGGSERFIDRTSGVPDPASLQPLEVSVMREFTCEDADVGTVMPIVAVQDAPGEQLVIRPGGAPCAFQLLHRAGTVESALSTSPSGYLIAQARKLPDGVRLACASEVAHHAVAGTAALRFVDGVDIRCWASGTTVFTASALAVQGGSDWAPWVRSLEPDPAQSGAYRMIWARDFTFQFFNMSDQGRPPTDGLYQTALAWDGNTLTVGATTKVSSVTNPFDGAKTTPWSPTPDEVSELGGFIDFSGMTDGGP